MDAAIWRRDGVIHFVLPPGPVVLTWMAFGLSHRPMSCIFMAEVGALLSIAIVEEFLPSMGFVVDTMRGVSEQSHGHTDVSRITRSVGGAFIGTCHPAELAAIAINFNDLAGPVPNEVKRTAEMWKEAAKKYARPAEKIAAYMGSEGE